MSILIYFASIFWSLFPNLIHVFQGGENQVIKVDETNLVLNGNFSDGVNPWSFIGSPTIVSTLNGFITILADSQDDNVYQTISLINGDDYYWSFNALTTRNDYSSAYTNITNITGFATKWLLNEQTFYSYIGTSTSTNGVINIKDFRTNNYDNFSVGNIRLYNISTMINNGVKNDDGILFSDLSNEEIKIQLDKWINDYGDLTYKIDNTYDKWFNTGFVEKTAERDFIDYLGYFFWLTTPPIILFATLDLIRRVL